MASDVDMPYLWAIDSEHGHLSSNLDGLDLAVSLNYLAHDQVPPDQAEEKPDAILVSSEIAGGADGEAFSGIITRSAGAPVLVVSRLRSLSQALAFIRSGAADFLPLPLEKDELEERIAAAVEKAATQAAVSAVMMELETVDGGHDEVTVNVHDLRPLEDDPHNDILAELCREDSALAGSLPADPVQADDDEPETVDGLPIPTMWEELPCGLLVFDSNGNLVFSNTLALDLFGHGTLVGLQDALDNDRAAFAAHGTNHKPLPDNQWPHTLAWKARAPRSAVVSIDRPDKRRVWLRIDCLPHITDGKPSRLSMTLVNMTGELPPLASQAPQPVVKKREKSKPRAKRKK